MSNRSIAIIGILIYIFSVFMSAEDLTGESIIPGGLILLSKVLLIGYILIAVFRIWKCSKSISLILAITTGIYFGITLLDAFISPPDGSIYIISKNIFKVLSFIIFLISIFMLWTRKHYKNSYFTSNSEDNNLRKKEIPIIGKDIKWDEIVGNVYRIIEFDTNRTKIDNHLKVKAKSIFKPYGYLFVESPIIDSTLILPIVHKTDFQLAYTAYNNSELNDLLMVNDLLVTYVPKFKLPGSATGVTHGLHFAITSKKTIENYYKLDYKLNPKLEKIFGPFVYDGMVEVKVNITPELEDN